VLTLIFDNPTFNFPRTYLRGFVGSTGITSFRIEGGELKFSYLLTYDIIMPIDLNFYDPNSNVYSCDHIFQNDNCQIFIGSVPIDAGAHIKVRYVPPDQGLRCWVLANLVIDNTITADLPILPDYWNPGV